MTGGKGGAAFAIALAGAAISLVFDVLDHRARDMVAAGEAAVRQFEDRLAARTGVEAIRLADPVDTRRISRNVSFSRSVYMFHGLAVVLWLDASVVVWLRPAMWG